MRKIELSEVLTSLKYQKWNKTEKRVNQNDVYMRKLDTIYNKRQPREN